MLDQALRGRDVAAVGRDIERAIALGGCRAGRATASYTRAVLPNEEIAAWLRERGSQIHRMTSACSEELVRSTWDGELMWLASLPGLGSWVELHRWAEIESPRLVVVTDPEQLRDVRLRLLLASAPRCGQLRVLICEASEGAQPFGEQDRLDVLERRCAELVTAGRFDEACDVYWNEMGNFAELRYDGQAHRGMRVCRILNSGQPPREVAEGLRSTSKAMAILNDWGQFASVLGDTETHLAAAEEALRQAKTIDQVRPWNLEMLSRHLSQAHLSRGELGEALRQARNARQYAVAGARQLEGMPSRETMDAFDDSAAALADVAIRLEGHTAVTNVLDELVAIHDRQRKVLESLNRGAIVVSYPGPTEATRPEELLDGEPSALVALGEDRPGDAVTLMSRHRILGPRQGLIVLRALQELSDVDNAEWLLDDMKDLYGRNDDIPMLAELALREAAVSEPEGALAIIEPWLVAADELGLGLLWTDLTLARAGALLAQDDLVRAASAARAAFDRCMSGGYRMGARKAVTLLDSAGAETSPDEVAWAHRPGWEPGETPLARKPPRTIPSIGPDRRSDLDNAARQVLKDYMERKVPFALYLRAFAVTVWHGPMEYGLQLLENVVSGAIAGFANVITIQDQNLGLYSGSGSPSDRTAPALLLGNEQWQGVAEQLILHADLIISEALFLRPGVRYELERIHANGAWGRTILVLPPPGGELPELDGDPLIQLFPRCVWAEDFHTTPFERHPVSAPLLDRLNRIAADPEAEHPLDLTELARHYESTAMADEVFLYSDDPDFADRRYRSFWRHFRANSIRLTSVTDGVPLSDADRLSIANNYVHMASIMLDASAEGDRYVVTGDIEFAQLAAHQAYVLYGPDLPELQSLAAQKLRLAQRLAQALADGDPRFIVRPRYGRITTGEA